MSSLALFADPRPVTGAPLAPVVRSRRRPVHDRPLRRRVGCGRSPGDPSFARAREPEELALKREAKVEDVRPTAVVVAMPIGRIVASAADGVYQGLLEDIRGLLEVQGV